MRRFKRSEVPEGATHYISCKQYKWSRGIDLFYKKYNSCNNWLYHTGIEYKLIDLKGESPIKIEFEDDVHCSDVDKTLSERGSVYGEFKDISEIYNALKKVVDTNNGKLSPIHKTALDMIMQKISRVLNGDPNYIDNWHDIAGYATLVVKELEKK
jgi:hypothetical protein